MRKDGENRMVDFAMISEIGGRKMNEDFILHTGNEQEECFILCDGLGGHERGEVASRTAAETVKELFDKRGDYGNFLPDAFNLAQEKLLELQEKMCLIDAMKTTMVVLVVTPEIIKWAHIGDSRLYHVFGDGKFERTKDHSMAQVLCDVGEIKEVDIRSHDDRNKLMRVLGAGWGRKSFSLSPILEIEGHHSFALMTDGFWEYVYEEEMIEILENTSDSKQWLSEMQRLVEERADMKKTDNYSAICVRV